MERSRISDQVCENFYFGQFSASVQPIRRHARIIGSKNNSVWFSFLLIVQLDIERTSPVGEYADWQASVILQRNFDSATRAGDTVANLGILNLSKTAHPIPLLLLSMCCGGTKCFSEMPESGGATTGGSPMPSLFDTEQFGVGNRIRMLPA